MFPKSTYDISGRSDLGERSADQLYYEISGVANSSKDEFDDIASKPHKQQGHLTKHFPERCTDSRRALGVCLPASVGQSEHQEDPSGCSRRVPEG